MCAILSVLVLVGRSNGQEASAARRSAARSDGFSRRARPPEAMCIPLPLRLRFHWPEAAAYPRPFPGNRQRRTPGCACAKAGARYDPRRTRPAPAPAGRAHSADMAHPGAQKMRGGQQKIVEECVPVMRLLRPVPHHKPRPPGSRLQNRCPGCRKTARARPDSRTPRPASPRPRMQEIASSRQKSWHNENRATLAGARPASRPHAQGRCAQALLRTEHRKTVLRGRLAFVWMQRTRPAGSACAGLPLSHQIYAAEKPLRPVGDTSLPACG